ncbi:hypothetical protein RclHR1_13560003 [Rhizophagus clarus]|uniref:Crinkler effector protein N-terminal domain-containing protein n=1 Tax=Rhizophagus clarus TaxID=94130 RepID=A0A2Z6R2Q2_9GLOM|nr:hypothetical protein RclHR1_13560003 [Rhizophagus clarus]GES78022.1 hypothetical protein GLOIN_2v1770201 [Rhizophagus clarus]
MSDKSKASDKFDKLVEGGDIIFYCLTPSENTFDVQISSANKNQVSFLTKVIRNCRLDLFKDIDLSKLILYMNKGEADSVVILSLKNDKRAILSGTELMKPENTIFSYFNNQLQPKYQGEKGINIIVYPPTDN